MFFFLNYLSYFLFSEQAESKKKTKIIQERKEKRKKETKLKGKKRC